MKSCLLQRKRSCSQVGSLRPLSSRKPCPCHRTSISTNGGSRQRARVRVGRSECVNVKIVPNKAAESQRRATPAYLPRSARASGAVVGDKVSLRSPRASWSLRKLEHKVDHPPSHRKACSLLSLAYGKESVQGRPWAQTQGLGGIMCLRPKTKAQVLFQHYQLQF